MEDYLRSSVVYLGEKRACHMMRSRLGWFAKGMRFSSQFREAIKKISSEDEALEIIRQYKIRLQQAAALKQRVDHMVNATMSEAHR